MKSASKIAVANLICLVLAVAGFLHTERVNAQVVFAPFTCEYYESMCATPEEAAAARKRRMEQQATAHQAALERELEKQQIETWRQDLEKQLGEHRKVEIDRLLALRQKAQENTAQAAAALQARRRLSCEATVKQYNWVPCSCVGLVPDQGGTACGM